MARKGKVEEERRQTTGPVPQPPSEVEGNLPTICFASQISVPGKYLQA